MLLLPLFNLLLKVGFTPAVTFKTVLTALKSKLMLLNFIDCFFFLDLCSIAGELEFSSKVMAYQNIFCVLLVLEELLKETFLMSHSSETGEVLNHVFVVVDLICKDC